MYGAGLGDRVTKRAAFAFDVKQSSRSAERGWLVLHGERRAWTAGLVVRGWRVRGAVLNPRGNVSFNGIDTWIGQRGYRFDVTATDGGGHGRDRFAVVVKAPMARWWCR